MGIRPLARTPMFFFFTNLIGLWLGSVISVFEVKAKSHIQNLQPLTREVILERKKVSMRQREGENWYRGNNRSPSATLVRVIPDLKHEQSFAVYQLSAS